MLAFVRARRSCLSVPASSQKMLAKARGLPADEVVIDLEDAVAPEAKTEARAAAVSALEADWGGSAVAIRINAVGSEWWRDDVIELAAAGAALASLVVPKCERAADLESVASLLDDAPGAHSDAIGLQALIETASGLVAVREICAASPRLEALIVGYADLSASLGRPAAAEYPGDRWHWVRETVLVHARAAGLAAIDGPHLSIEDEQGLRASAEGARALGYDGKWAIHPAQLGALNELFSPAPEEVERARAVLDRLAGTGGGQPGVTELDGEMVDEASRKQAERVIARAERVGAQDS
ncbi:MAG: HpcH/HpaI aldolase/citrate lyase family protein [Solirubrobacterales bacterium]